MRHPPHFKNERAALQAVRLLVLQALGNFVPTAEEKERAQQSARAIRALLRGHYARGAHLKAYHAKRRAKKKNGRR